MKRKLDDTNRTITNSQSDYIFDLIEQEINYNKAGKKTGYITDKRTLSEKGKSDRNKIIAQVKEPDSDISLFIEKPANYGLDSLGNTDLTRGEARINMLEKLNQLLGCARMSMPFDTDVSSYKDNNENVALSDDTRKQYFEAGERNLMETLSEDDQVSYSNSQPDNHGYLIDDFVVNDEDEIVYDQEGQESDVETIINVGNSNEHGSIADRVTQRRRLNNDSPTLP